MKDAPTSSSLSTVIVDIAGQLATHLAAPDSESRIAAISLISALDRLTDRALHTIVHEARDAGFSWQQIGDITGTSRQGAAQRFGSSPPTPADLPIEPLADAVPLAATTLTTFCNGDPETVRPIMSTSVSNTLTKRRIATIRSQLMSLLGHLEGIDEGSAAVSILGDLTIVQLPLRFSGGPAVGKVTFTPEATILGFWINPLHEGQTVNG